MKFRNRTIDTTAYHLKIEQTSSKVLAMLSGPFKDELNDLNSSSNNTLTSIVDLTNFLLSDNGNLYRSNDSEIIDGVNKLTTQEPIILKALRTSISTPLKSISTSTDNVDATLQQPCSSSNSKRPESLQSIFAPPHPSNHCSIPQDHKFTNSRPSGHKRKSSNADEQQKSKEEQLLDSNLNIVTTGSGNKVHGDQEEDDELPEDQYEIEIYDNGNAFDSPSVRGSFLRKVLAIVSLQLLMVTAWTVLCVNFEPIGNFIQTFNWIAFAAIGMYCVLYFTVGCLRIGRKFPANLIILFLYTATLSYICSYVTLQYSTWTIMISLSATITICLIIYVVTLLTKLDITGWGIYLTTACCLMMLYASSVFTCSFILTDSKTMNILNITGAFFGSFLVSLYLLYDIQMMIGGFLREIDSEEWLFAAMALFYDVVMIFVYLVQIIGLTGNRPPRSSGQPNSNSHTIQTSL